MIFDEIKIPPPPPPLQSLSAITDLGKLLIQSPSTVVTEQKLSNINKNITDNKLDTILMIRKEQRSSLTVVPTAAATTTTVVNSFNNDMNINNNNNNTIISTVSTAVIENDNNNYYDARTKTNDVLLSLSSSPSSSTSSSSSSTAAAAIEESSSSSMGSTTGSFQIRIANSRNAESILRFISCEHINSWKTGLNGLQLYKKLYDILILSLNKNSRKFKATLWHCYDESCPSKRLPQRIHVCLFCNMSACFTSKHIHQHWLNTNHNLAMDIHYGHVYCFHCDNYKFDVELEMIASQLRRNTLIRNAKFPYKWEPNAYEEVLFDLLAATKRLNVHRGYNGLRGLINLGSTCFMNCIVQTLVHTEPLRDYFLGDRHICIRDSSKCLVCEMSQLVQEFYSGEKKPHVPVKLLHLVWTHAKHLAGYEQQDAHEFFISTLNILHRHSSESNDDPSTNSSSNNSSHSSSNNNDNNNSNNKKCNCIIDKIFTGSLQSDLVCQSCGCVKSTVDPIWDFSLDIVNHHHHINNNNNNNGNFENRLLNQTLSKSSAAIKASAPTLSLSLNDCLELFTRTEHLGSLAKIQCDNCQSYQESTKQLSLKTLPIVVSFHLKRFEQTNKLNKKITTFVSFPTIIDMTPFTTSEIGHQARSSQMKNAQSNNDNNGDEDFRPPMKKRRKDNSYSLFAVVNHSGTLETGHYTVFVRCNGHWFKCDDHSVTKATEKDVLNSEGYLLFYQKNHYEYQ